MNWTSRRIEHLAREVRTTIDPSHFGEDDVDHYSIPALDASGGPERQPASEIQSHKQLLVGGEVLLSRLNPRKARVLTVPQLDGRPAIASGEFIVLRPADVEPRFLEYLLLSETTRQFLDSAVQSVTRSHQRIRPEQLLKLRVTVPVELGVQRAIVDFLDTETNRIDTLIAKKRELNALILECAWAEVHRLVTLGTGRSAGGEEIPWLGPVSSSWPAPHIGVISSIYPGTSFPADEQGLSEGDYPFLKVADLGKERATHVEHVTNWVTYETARRLGARLAPAGAVAYARVGAALLLNPRRILTEPTILDDNVRAIAFDRGDPRYWAYLLSFLDLGQWANPGPVPSISEGQVSAVRVPCPEPEEQRRIADEADGLMKAARRKVRLLDRQIDLLQEHRQALITAAVTGEMEVPGVAA